MCPADMVPVPDTPHVCIDRFELPNQAGAHPTLALSATRALDGRTDMSADAICASSGKRLCHRSEWTQACLGTPLSACHTSKRWLRPSWAKINQRNPHELARLDQSDAAGAFIECTSSVGAFDMIGNAEEWVTCDGPTGYCLVGGYWSGGRSCTRAISNHNGRWWHYGSSARCCVDVGPSWHLRVKQLNDAMLDKLATEVRNAWTSNVWTQRVRTLSRMNVSLGTYGILIDSHDDPFLLAAVQWHESRFNPEARGGGGAWVGAMQIHTGNGPLLRQIDPAWRSVQPQQLWDPITNVRAGYAILNYAKTRCGGNPVTWLTSYRYPHCKKSDKEGKARWATMQDLLARAKPLTLPSTQRAKNRAASGSASSARLVQKETTLSPQRDSR